MCSELSGHEAPSKGMSSVIHLEYMTSDTSGNSSWTLRPPAVLSGVEDDRPAGAARPVCGWRVEVLRPLKENRGQAVYLRPSVRSCVVSPVFGEFRGHPVERAEC